MTHHAKVLIRLVSATALLLAPARSGAQTAPYLTEVLKKPAYRTAWTQLLASSKPTPSWLTTFTKTSNGVETPSTPVTVAGQTYEAYSVCKPHDCSDNRLEVIYAPGGQQAWGILIVNAGKPRYLGSPDAAMTSALNQIQK